MAIGNATISSSTETANVLALGRSYTLSELNSLKLPSSATYKVDLAGPDIASFVNPGNATNRGTFLGPFIFTNLRFTFPFFIPDDAWILKDARSGVLILGSVLGSATIAAKAIPTTGYKVLKYDPFEYGIVLGVSTPLL